MKTIRIILSLIMLPCMFAKAGKFEQLPDHCTLEEKHAPDPDTLVIYDNNKNKKIVGSATYRPHFGSLDILFVDPEYQNKGFGTFLFKKVCVKLAEHSCDRMVWGTISDVYNDPELRSRNLNRLHRFYENLGAKTEKVYEKSGYRGMSIDLTPYRT